MVSKIGEYLSVAFFGFGIVCFISCSTFQKKGNDLKLSYDH